MEKYTFDDMVDVLSTLNVILGDVKADEYERKLSDSDKYRDFMEKFESLKHDVSNAVSDAKSAIESPIYAGVMGHYSHGKSSVLNALLFPQKGEWLLPTGEGIVTSLCTLVAFNSKGAGNEFSEVLTSHENHHLSKEEFVRKASGKLSIENVHYFNLKLDTGDLATEIFNQFYDKKIELLDTPGLGGPYWNDEHTMQRWVKQFALLIVCIKADEINENTAMTLNPFLKMSASPVIPVVTFWDSWEGSGCYEGISDEKRAKAHAKELIRKHVPVLSDAADLAQFVSAKNYQLDKTVSDGSSPTMWGIENLRSAISSFVNDKQDILQSNRQEASGLDVQRKRSVIDRCQKVEMAFKSFSEQLDRDILSLKPETAYQAELDDTMDRLTEELEREIQRVADRLEQKVSDQLGAIEASDGFSRVMGDIQKNITGELQQLLNDSVGRRLNRSVYQLVIRELTRWSEKNTPLSKEQIIALERDLERTSKHFIEDVTSAQRVELVEIPTGLDAMIKNYGKIFLSFDGMKAIGIAFCFFILAQAVNFIPLAGDILSSFCYGLMIAIPGFSLWTDFGHAKDKTLLEMKDKARAKNKHADIRQRLEAHFREIFDAFKEASQKILDDHLETPQDTGDQMMQDIKDLISDINKNVRSLHKMAVNLRRGIAG